MVANLRKKMLEEIKSIGPAMLFCFFAFLLFIALITFFKNKSKVVYFVALIKFFPKKIKKSFFLKVFSAPCSLIRA